MWFFKVSSLVNVSSQFLHSSVFSFVLYLRFSMNSFCSLFLFFLSACFLSLFTWLLKLVSSAFSILSFSAIFSMSFSRSWIFLFFYFRVLFTLFNDPSRISISFTRLLFSLITLSGFFCKLSFKDSLLTFRGLVLASFFTVSINSSSPLFSTTKSSISLSYSDTFNFNLEFSYVSISKLSQELRDICWPWRLTGTLWENFFLIVM